MAKRIFLIFCFILPAAGAAYGQDRSAMEQLWNEGNNKYINGDYDGAVVVYDSIVNSGYASGRLYYNLGNAHFKAGRTGKSIVNYNKALKLIPYDKDVEYNLSVANSYIKDRIDTVPEFFLARWMRKWRMTLDSNAWAVVSIVNLILAFAGILAYVLTQRQVYRKAGFFGGVLFAVLFIFSVSFAAIERNELLDASEAVVIPEAISVKSSPGPSSQELFIIHEGTKVLITGKYNGWTEVLLPDGNKGWVVTSSIELID